MACFVSDVIMAGREGLVLVFEYTYIRVMPRACQLQWMQCPEPSPDLPEEQAGFVSGVDPYTLGQAKGFHA